MAPEMMVVKSNPNISFWSLDKGYDKGINERGYPVRVFNARQDAALIIFLKLFQRDLEYVCRGPVQGFKIILNTPGQTLKISRHAFRVPLAEQAEISIKPRLITTSKELLRYSPSQRKCFFSSERQLRFFRYYAQHNCESECLANYTKVRCGCVKFSMPSKSFFFRGHCQNDPKNKKFNFIGKRGTRICGAASVRCYKLAEKNLFGEDVIDGLRDERAKRFRIRCNCLPACTSIVYDAEIDRAKFDWMATLSSFKIPADQYSG